MKLTLKTVDSDQLNDDFEVSPQKHDVSYNLLKRHRFKTEISIQNIKLKDIENDFNSQLLEIEQKKLNLKQRVSQQKSIIQSLNGKLQKKQSEINLLEDRLKFVMREMSSLFKVSNTPQKIKFTFKSDKKQKSLAKTQINEQETLDQFMLEYNEEYRELWQKIQTQNKEKQLTKINIQILEQKILILENELKALLQTEKVTRDRLLDHLYSQCTLENCHGQALIDIVRKVKQLNQNFDVSKLPKELDPFEKQYIMDKVQFERIRKSTIILNENYSQKLKIKNQKSQLIKKSPLKLDYLKKVIGQCAYQYIPILNENPFKDLSRSKILVRPQRVKSLEQNAFHRKDTSIDSIY